VIAGRLSGVNRPHRAEALRPPDARDAERGELQKDRALPTPREPPNRCGGLKSVQLRTTRQAAPCPSSIRYHTRGGAARPHPPAQAQPEAGTAARGQYAASLVGPPAPTRLHPRSAASRRARPSASAWGTRPSRGPALRTRSRSQTPTETAESRVMSLPTSRVKRTAGLRPGAGEGRGSRTRQIAVNAVFCRRHKEPQQLRGFPHRPCWPLAGCAATAATTVSARRGMKPPTAAAPPVVRAVRNFKRRLSPWPSRSGSGARRRASSPRLRRPPSFDVPSWPGAHFRLDASWLSADRRRPGEPSARTNLWAPTIRGWDIGMKQGVNCPRPNLIGQGG